MLHGVLRVCALCIVHRGAQSAACMVHAYAWGCSECMGAGMVHRERLVACMGCVW